MYTVTLDGETIGSGPWRLVASCVADAVTRLLAEDHAAADDVAAVHHAVTTGAALETVQVCGHWQADVTVGGQVVTLRVVRVTMTG